MLGRKVYKRGHKVKKHARQTDVDKVRYFEIIVSATLKVNTWLSNI